MVSADNLNLDVLELIFEFLSGNDLPSVAQVSRSFLAGVVPRLYRNVSYGLRQSKAYTTQETMSPFASILAHPHLAVHVRHIDIRAVPIATPTKRKDSKFAHESVEALRLCKNLRTFRCIVPTMFPLYLPALEGKPQLEELWTDGKLSQSQSEQLLKITRLNSLRLDGTTWNVVDLLPLWTKNISSSLNELVLYMIADLNEDILKSIFQEVPQLASLHVVACAKVNHVTLLRIAAPLTRLESLSFTVTENTSPLAQPPPSFQRLKHLALDTHYSPSPSPTSTILLSVLLYLKSSSPLSSFTMKLPERKVLVGDPFIKQLVESYGHTLRRLAFFDCGISQSSLIEICKSCIHLDRLEVSVPMKELNTFIKNLGRSKTLHTLEDLENHVDHGVQTPLSKENVRYMMTKCPSLRRVITKHRIWTGGEPSDGDLPRVSFERRLVAPARSTWFMPHE
ncbi:hypothetical protein BJ165DRAFT_1346918 [Panaeolus papilionaceus]|nr:hypothetical protein BJ165DRAFT_1346918 [Panaeolus papilionaceus]